MDPVAHLVDTPRLDQHEVVAQVKVHIYAVVIVVLNGTDEVCHVIQHRLGLERIRSQGVDMSQKLLQIHNLLGFLCQLLELLNLLAVQLLNVWLSGWSCGAGFFDSQVVPTHGPRSILDLRLPQRSNQSLDELRREVECSSRVHDSEVDSGLHFV